MILQGLCEHEMDVAIMKKQEEEKVALLRMTANVQVAVRVRPLNKREKDLRISQGVREEDWLKVILQRSFDLPGAVDVETENKEEGAPCDVVKLANGGLSKPDTYSFDYCFDANVSQKYVYDQAMRNSVDGFLLGFNCTIFAYGQTGSGCVSPEIFHFALAYLAPHLLIQHHTSGQFELPGKLGPCSGTFTVRRRQA